MTRTTHTSDQYIRTRLDTTDKKVVQRESASIPPPKLIRITTVPVSLSVLLRRQLQFMSAYFDVLAVASPGKELEKVAAEEGVRTEAVGMTRAITPVRDMIALWKLYRLIKREQPDIVHTHTPKAGLLGMIAARLAGVPVRMHTVAGLPLMEAGGWKKRILKWAERLTYACATSVYPNSRNLTSYILAGRFCDVYKLKVLGHGSSNGIDMDYFRPSPEVLSAAGRLKRELGIEADDFVFVFIGRLVKDKGITELVEAFAALRTKYRPIKLLLVGPFEPERDPLPENVMAQIAADPAILHVGFREDVRPYLAISQVLTFPSYREGFPNVPMQAGCFSIPSIVTDINGCNEIIEGGKNGLLIPVKQAEPLRAAMELLLTNDGLYSLLKADARRWIKERYEQKQFWDLLLTEYHDQLKSHSLVS